MITKKRFKKIILMVVGFLAFIFVLMHYEGSAHPSSGYSLIQTDSVGELKEAPVVQIREDSSLVRVIWGDRINGTIKYRTNSLHVAEYNMSNQKIAYSTPSNVDTEESEWRSFSPRVSLTDEAGLAKSYVAFPFPTLWLYGHDISNPHLSLRLGKIGIVKTFFHNQTSQRNLAWQVVVGDISKPGQVCHQVLIDPHGQIGILISSDFKRVYLFSLTPGEMNHG